MTTITHNDHLADAEVADMEEDGLMAICLRKYPDAFVVWIHDEIAEFADCLPLYETAEEIASAFRAWLNGSRDYYRRGKMTGHQAIEHLRLMQHPKALAVLAEEEAKRAFDEARVTEASFWRNYEVNPYPENRQNLLAARAELAAAESALYAARAAIAA